MKCIFKGRVPVDASDCDQKAPVNEASPPVPGFRFVCIHVDLPAAGEWPARHARADFADALDKEK